MRNIRGVILKIHKKFLSPSGYIKWLRKQGMEIGEGCEIYKDAELGSEPYLIKIGNKVRISHNVQFITHDGGLWVLRNLGLINPNADKYGIIVIKDNCNIGWNVIIMPGVTIGENCVIGAGAVVTKNVPANTVVGGVPARAIESINDYYEKVNLKTIDIRNYQIKEKKRYLQKYFEESNT